MLPAAAWTKVRQLLEGPHLRHRTSRADRLPAKHELAPPAVSLIAAFAHSARVAAEVLPAYVSRALKTKPIQAPMLKHKHMGPAAHALVLHADDLHSDEHHDESLLPAPGPAGVEDSAQADLSPLPPEVPDSFHGSSHAKGKNYTVKVVNEKGYMARVELEAHFEGVHPMTVFAVLSNPNNAGVFRSIKDVGDRVLLESSHHGKVREIQVDQLGETRFLWWRRAFTTRLHVHEDERDPLHPFMTFSLIHSELVSAFDGSWKLEPLSLPSSGETGTPGTRLVLVQQVSPRGVPTFMRSMPLMGGLLRGGIQRAVCDVVDDLTVVVDMVRYKGFTVADAIQERKRKAGKLNN